MIAVHALFAVACADPVHIRLLEPAPASDDASEHGPDSGPAEQPAPSTPDAEPGGEPDARTMPQSDAAQPDAAQPDAAQPDAAQPDAGLPEASLALRYDFAGTGTRVIDLVGGADAVVMGGAELDGAGGVALDGRDDFVDMPNGILSRHESVTIVVWLEWSGAVENCWQRIFDFGVSDAGEGMMGNAVTSLFMTPSNCPRYALMVMAEFPGAQYGLVAEAALPQGRVVQVALSIDGRRSTVTAYVDGSAITERALPFQLRDIDDVNNWLGRSQWVQDLHLLGRYEELRMYDGVLSAQQIAELNARGPDAP